MSAELKTWKGTGDDIGDQLRFTVCARSKAQAHRLIRAWAGDYAEYVLKPTTVKKKQVGIWSRGIRTIFEFDDPKTWKRFKRKVTLRGVERITPNG